MRIIEVTQAGGLEGEMPQSGRMREEEINGPRFSPAVAVRTPSDSSRR